MANRESILQAIDELEARLEEMEEQERVFNEGDVVDYTYDGESGVAVVESYVDGLVTIRVMAVAGDTYEPTDNVYTVEKESLSLHNEPQSEEEDVKEEVEEEEIVEKGAFVGFMSKAGYTVGRVIDMDTSVVIPETGAVIDSTKKLALIEVYEKNDGYEDTGVHVAHPVDAINVIDPIDVKMRRAIIKMKNTETILDEQDGIGILKGIGSAYGKVDLGGDSIAKGAYTQTIAHNEGKIQLMFDHGYTVEKVAGVAEIEDSEEGLMVTAKMPLHIPSIREKYDINRFMVEEGKPLGFSIGYRVVKSDYMQNGVRLLKEIALEEMTITPYPMDTYARIQEAKSRKVSYHNKRKDWQSLQEIDAPTGNQTPQDDYKSLVDELKQLKDKLMR